MMPSCRICRHAVHAAMYAQQSADGAAQHIHCFECRGRAKLHTLSVYRDTSGTMRSVPKKPSTCAHRIYAAAGRLQAVCYSIRSG